MLERLKWQSNEKVINMALSKLDDAGTTSVKNCMYEASRCADQQSLQPTGIVVWHISFWFDLAAR